MKKSLNVLFKTVGSKYLNSATTHFAMILSAYKRDRVWCNPTKVSGTKYIAYDITQKVSVCSRLANTDANVSFDVSAHCLCNTNQIT